MLETTKPTEPNEAEQSQKDGGKDAAQSILDFGSAMTRTSHGNVYCLSVIGQIEGHTTAGNQTKTTKYAFWIPAGPLKNIKSGSKKVLSALRVL